MQTTLGDGVDRNDVPFRPTFPYLGVPAFGRQPVEAQSESRPVGRLTVMQRLQDSVRTTWFRGRSSSLSVVAMVASSRTGREEAAGPPVSTVGAADSVAPGAPAVVGRRLERRVREMESAARQAAGRCRRGGVCWPTRCCARRASPAIRARGTRRAGSSRRCCREASGATTTPTGCSRGVSVAASISRSDRSGRRRAATRGRYDPVNYGVIGDAHLELGEYDEAFDAFDRMMELRPSAAAYARVAYARELQGNWPARSRR